MVVVDRRKECFLTHRQRMEAGRWNVVFPAGTYEHSSCGAATMQAQYDREVRLVVVGRGGYRLCCGSHFDPATKAETVELRRQ